MNVDIDRVVIAIPEKDIVSPEDLGMVEHREEPDAVVVGGDVNVDVDAEQKKREAEAELGHDAASVNVNTDDDDEEPVAEPEEGTA